MPFDLKRLRTFVAVAEELGFARAGARLGLAQPAVSKHVRDLEEAVGGLLIERRPEGLRLTSAGSALLDEARVLLDAVGRARERVERLARGETGTLVVGYNETVSWNSVIPRALRRFRDAHSEVALDLRPMLSIEQIEALKDRRIDAGFMFRWGAEQPDLAALELLRTPIRLAVPEHSRWAERPPQTLADLAEEPFLLFPRRSAPAYHDALMAACAAAGFAPDVVQEIYNESAALGLVAVGVGITFVPETARHRSPAAVRIVPVPDLDIVVTLELVWRRESTEHPLVRRLVEAARQASCQESPLAEARLS